MMILPPRAEWCKKVTLYGHTKIYILPYYRQRLIVDYNYALCVILEYSRLGSVYDFDLVILVFQSKIELWECFNRHYWECGNKNCTHQLQIAITIHKNTLHNDNFRADFRPLRGYRVSRLHMGDDIARINMSQEGCLWLSDVDLKTQAKVLHREKHYNNMYDLIYKYKLVGLKIHAVFQKNIRAGHVQSIYRLARKFSTCLWF